MTGTWKQFGARKVATITFPGWQALYDESGRMVAKVTEADHDIRTSVEVLLIDLNAREYFSDVEAAKAWVEKFDPATDAPKPKPTPGFEAEAIHALKGIASALESLAVAATAANNRVI